MLIPLSPVAERVTASLVEVSPSIVIRLKLSATAFFNKLSSVAASILASVPTNASIVAKFGQIMPAPLDIPVMVHERPSNSNCLLLNLGRVSVVKIAEAARLQLVSDRSPIACGKAAMIASVGKASPITPVENGKI